MEKLKLRLDEKEVKIEFDEKFAKGIYLVNTSKRVKKNIQVLNIKFDDSVPDNVLQNKVTKIGSWSFLTSGAADSYFQLIFMSSASMDDVYYIIEGKDEAFKKLVIQTFNLAKLNRLSDFVNRR